MKGCKPEIKLVWVGSADLSPGGRTQMSNEAGSSAIVEHAAAQSSGSNAASSSGADANSKRHHKGERGVTVHLQNVVATVDLRCQSLNLQHIVSRLRNAEYNPRKFSACVIKLREPKTTALLFSSGKMVVTGAKCQADAKIAAAKFGSCVKKLGYNVKMSPNDFKISNVVASCDVQFAIRLEGLAYEHGKSAAYEPELFPGLIYRMAAPKVVLLIFVSGKVVLTGGKSHLEILEAFKKIYPVLFKYRKQAVNVTH